ncbi:hypothetical protein A2U01_0097128, partial [Trifolium medium]|nr:hypothetical protein [Trifolium medium]
QGKPSEQDSIGPPCNQMRKSMSRNVTNAKGTAICTWLRLSSSKRYRPRGPSQGGELTSSDPSRRLQVKTDT